MADDTIQQLRDQIAELKAKADAGWMSDVQRILAILLIGTFTLLIVVFAFRLMFSADITTAAALLKELKDALVQMVMMALGFFFGSTMAKMASDKASQSVVDKLTSPPPAGLVSAAPTATAPTPWWNKLTPDEQKAIPAASAADPTDTKLSEIASGPVKMKPDQEEIDYLVKLGLLTPERAKVIQGA